jgi:NedA-like, galactose-binding domain/F5/8 type C domain/Putative Ig domain
MHPVARLLTSVFRGLAAAAAPLLLAALLVPGAAAAASAASCGTTNLALGHPATASSTESSAYPASNAVDGNTGTRWSSAFSDPQWIQIDLGSTQTICQVVLQWEAASGKAYQIQTSPDASTWTTIFSTTSGPGGTETLSVSGSGRYVRMFGTARNTQYGYSLWEFSVFGPAGGGSCGTANAALNHPATASSLENATFPAANAVDGNTGTRWSSAFSDPQWLQVDLGSTVSVCQVVLQWETASGKAYQIQVSNDASTWTTIFSTTTGPGGTETLNISGSGRYIRMFGTQRNTQYGYSLWEFQVFTTGGGGGGNTVTVTNPGAQNSTAGTAASLQIHATDSASGQTLAYSATGLPAGLSISSTSGLISGTPTTAGTSNVSVTAKDTTGASGSATFTWTVSAGGGSCPAQSNTPNFGPNVDIFDPGMSSSSIQATLDSVFNTQKLNQFGTQRFALLFKPGTYSAEANIGYYTSIAGLGQNPDNVTINGDVTVDAFDGTGNATQNFWRSAENLAINPSAGNDRWAVAQAGPFRRIDVHGGMNLAPASNGFASGGYIADTKVSGQVSSVSQQQWYSRDSNFGSWNGSVWNMVFSGVSGAPAQSFPSPPMTTLGTTPVSRDVPYLYIDSAGNYHVFEPSLRTNASGASWAGGTTAGTSLPMSQFFVADPSMSAAAINTALSQGCNLLFTPGVYNLNQTLNVTRADTTILGIGFPTLIPQNGVNTMQVADVNGVRIKGLLFDAGTANSAALLTAGTAGSAASHASDPISIQDVFFRIGGDIAGKATASLIVNANDTIVDDIWAWRADHGNSGTVGWTTNTADNGMTVNGSNVEALGLFVEHYQKTEVAWNGQNGKIIFFQNEMPYDPPNQAAWMNGSSNGYPAIAVASNVTSFGGWGLGSYCFFNVNPAVNSAMAFQSPTTSGVAWHDLLTVSLGGVGTISHVINTTGAVTASNTTPSDVVSYP